MKLLLSFFTLLIFSLPAMASFSDVPHNHKHADAIFYVQEAGLVAGYDDATYKPDQIINRVEFLKILLEASDLRCV